MSSSLSLLFVGLLYVALTGCYVTARPQTEVRHIRSLLQGQTPWIEADGSKKKESRIFPTETFQNENLAQNTLEESQEIVPSIADDYKQNEEKSHVREIRTSKSAATKLQESLARNPEMGPALLTNYKLYLRRYRRGLDGFVNGPNLSIINPMDVLRQRLLRDMAIRRLQQSQSRIDANTDLLRTIG